MVSTIDAMDAALRSAERVTLTGSMTPAATRSPYSPVAALRPWPTRQLARPWRRRRSPRRPAFSAIQRSGSAAALRTIGDAGGLVAVEPEVAVEDRGGVDEGGAATGDDALLDRGAGRGDGVLDAVLLLLELDLGVRRRP